MLAGKRSTGASVRMRSLLRNRMSTGIQYDHHKLSKELQALVTTQNEHFLNVLDEAQQRFYPRYVELRAARSKQQAAIREQVESGQPLDYRADTKWIRERRWKVGKIPEVLAKRPVELTGPANDASMMINAFNTGALARKVVPSADPKVPLVKYMPDGEDSSVPTLQAELQGILNLKQALEGTLSVEKNGKRYTLGEELAYPIYRVPGLHLDEASMVDRYNRPVPNHLLLTLLYQQHIAPLMRERGWVPSLYQPKLQSYEEACLVADVLAFSEKAFSLPDKSTRVTCLIETLSGALQAEEIVYALRHYLCALNAGRWDYIFQWIQVLQNTVTPDRAKLSMQAPHMEAYMDRIREVCERRGAVFMGGMSALIPHAQQSEAVLAKVADDKRHEQLHGAQGAWVAHPGMVEPVLRLFTADKHLVTPQPARNVAAAELVALAPALQEVGARTQRGLEQNISVGVQYVAAWLSGRGAVALNHLMEDMATAEICRAQVWQWLHQRATFTLDSGNIAQLTPEFFEEVFARVVKDLEKQNEVPYARAHLSRAADLFHEMVVSETLDAFIADRAYADLNQGVRRPEAKRDAFAPVTFNAEELVDLLPGSHNQGEGMVRARTKYFRELFARPNVTGHPRQFWFAGTSNPLVGAATVLGGGGHVGSYLGGWDANAVNNVLNKRLPDTLNVWVNDATNGARAINNHLRRDMEIENLDFQARLRKATEQGEDPHSRRALRQPFNWLAVPQLVDLEQGWRSIHHTRLAVDSALDQGINFVHIEDQGYHKRCGHLGDKELAPFDSYAQILRAANLTARLRLGQDQDLGRGMIFVARTDAYSAKRIEFSVNLSNPHHLDHPFVDFQRGPTPDGKYYYLKQGTNPATGNSFGLDLAIARMAEAVRLGLAEYVWMETPNADLHVAKAFIDGVNAKLEPHGRFAKMLYNHSPSFDWDLGFVKGAQPLGDAALQHVQDQLYAGLRSTLTLNGRLEAEHLQAAVESLRGFVREHGDPLQRDFDFSDATLREMLLHSLDALSDDQDAAARRRLVDEALLRAYPGAAVQQAIDALQQPVDRAEARRSVYRAIADARLGLFGKASASCGVELPLTTLPDFHYEAFAAHRLAMGLVRDSMQAYVHQVQRPERHHFEAQKGSAQPYPFYKHQESTGTGVDARFGKTLGSADTKALEESTEADDLRDRAQLEAKLGRA